MNSTKETRDKALILEARLRSSSGGRRRGGTRLLNTEASFGARRWRPHLRWHRMAAVSRPPGPAACSNKSVRSVRKPHIFIPSPGPATIGGVGRAKRIPAAAGDARRQQQCHTPSTSTA